MTPQQQAREQVIAAGGRMKEAAGRWNATDLAAMKSCTYSLEQCALELRETLETVRHNPHEEMTGLAAELLRMKSEARRLTRLTDASAAFLRCAPGMEGGASDFYGVGATRYSIPDAAPRGTEA